jgi:hypothetical protein
LEVVIERVWTCNFRPRPSEVGDALGGHDQSRFEENLEVVGVEAVDRMGGMTAAVSQFIG